MRVLILGGHGQLGTFLQRTFADHTLILPRQADLDMSQVGSIQQINELAPDLVLLPAAYTNVDGCALEPDLAFKHNTLGPKYVALACRQRDIPLMFVSTNEVFSGIATVPYSEYDQPNPINAYGRSKWGGEQAVLQHAPAVSIIRVAWLFGGQRNFIRTMLKLGRERMQTGEPLRVVDDEIGSPTYALDVAHAMRQLADQGIPGIYHIVNQGWCSRYELARFALESAKIEVPIEPIKLKDFSRPSTPPAFTPLYNGAASDLGINLRSWQDAVAEFVDVIQQETV